MNIKEISQVDKEHLKAVFNALYTEFHMWSSYHGEPWDLLRFADYEGVGGNLIENLLTYSAPFAVGDHLNKKCNFEWCKLVEDEFEQWGVLHPLLSEPISFEALLEGKWNREDYEEPESNWVVVVDSAYYIKLVLRWKKSYGDSKPLPGINTDELELELNRREVVH